MIIDAQRCVYCKACILICPHKALQSIEQEDKITILLDNNLCDNNCTKCMDICVGKCIDLKKSDIKEYKIDLYKCEKCNQYTNKSLSSNKTICKKCKMKMTATKVNKYIIV